ncbi:MAG TPA: M14 family zinc carboxypeptidase, partial [Thermoanaerobaculia bacterium]|nr:M14 family zinc carboxypeptidase [Thermoanaerobaculia bacterium]
TPEPGSAEAIAAATTAPEYLAATVASVPDSPDVPSPSDVLGHVAGAPGELSSVATVHGYFRRLAEASPRVEVRPVGTSEEGREILLAVVSSEANLARLDRIAEIGHRLADPRRTPAEAVPALVAEGKAVYYLIGGLHSTETGSPEMLMELAYRLAVSERPEIRRIRDEVVVLITPVVEPDGRDRVVEWYERHLRGRRIDGRELTWEEFREIGSPPYWGHYAFHDNNRDGMQLTLALTRAVNDVFFSLRPQVIHDLHESLPLLYISTGHGPYSQAIDPVTINEWTQLAHHEAGALAALGMPGVWVWGFWDGWWPGYLFSVANNHNAVGRFYETFGNSHPGTFERDLGDTRFVGKPVTEAQWYRPWPPGEKVTWSLRDNTNYMQAGVLEGLEYAARHREDLLENSWTKAARSLDKGRTEAPYAWVFPAEQRDPARLAYLVNQLRAHRIEVHRLAAELSLGDGEAARTWPAGSFVVRMDQPYRNAAVNFLSEQRFPPEEPNPPYDDVAWTWPLLYGVEGERVDDRAVLEAAMEPVTTALSPVGGVRGAGDVFLLADRGQNGLLAARLLLQGWQVDAVEESFSAGGVDYPAGSWVVQAPGDLVRRVGERLGLEFVAGAMPRVRMHLVDLPRLGLVHTWTATQDAGWARYTLDQAGMPYELVSPAVLRRGGLAERFDVLVFPDTWGGFARIVHGIDPRWSPLAYTQTAEFPSHGVPNGAEDITGGMGLEGLLELRRFVEAGGVLAAVMDAGAVAVEGGMVRRVERGGGGLRSPGSEVAARVLRPEHPVAYGYDERTSVFRGNGPVWQVDERDRRWAVVQFGDELPEGDEEPPGAPPIEQEDLAVAPMPVAQEELEEEDLGEDGLAELQVPPAPDSQVDFGMNTDAAAAGGAPDGVEAAPRELVLSGWVSAPKDLAGQPAILDVPAGRGRVLLFSFNPLHRYLNHSDFRFLYNVILHWNDLPR